ncbi:tRNA (adenosine(37)-N6)-threonylcarbamoyltransferase complex transferase subunit TsaD [candidate division CPR3 bacterium GWF2_35_18]|nr:MAG: tRNA (adenosine(37)-N6)-threonylcarbamoyltransferase complex transferase subunit TsaD [candidate division CPR3 bacterium GWF2_35_18]OGB64898.1 MAG: tRNA (adenosine(37)-N6)-threonylcarbamoyltransferase complex transferase subunit TsaD [candidate division CPR3 bacterium RIFOXYA2_FULL_35_13]OGB76955.1 MAG: tRNA (adenosine(37)-N6)-threonylcarbamoyltransferase complex transferase subunit TsaD [candidate division CPR3 bacterium RIFOXYC2_FULL_35_7]OGB79000.1 MAG: tRNA (adenosine(37)-N6)-threony
MHKNYKVLAIDTSCDETSVAVTVDDKIFSNVISSQVDLHRKWGGVVPTIAKRAHKENIDQAISEAIKRAQMKLENIDAIGVTCGPGLAMALEIGLDKAKELAQKYKKPLIAINHMEGHLLSPLLKNSKGKGNEIQKNTFPALGLLVSGGHTELILIKKIGNYQKIGQTVDDAAGEAFDKFANMLDLGYPGGEIVEEFAKKGDKNKYILPRPMEKSRDLNYSFSGLKTAALYLIRDLKKKTHKDFLNKEIVYDLCASFQKAVVDSLVIKLQKAIVETKPNSVFCGGGVTSNLTLRKNIRKIAKSYNLPVYFPYLQKLNTDNAAMIGIASYYKAKRDEFWKNELKELERNPGLSFKII